MTTVDRSKILENIAEELRCSVCLSLFVDPLLLKCLHTLCRGCVMDLVQAGSVKCPMCNDLTICGTNATNLGKNYIAASIVSLLRTDPKIAGEDFVCAVVSSSSPILTTTQPLPPLSPSGRAPQSYSSVRVDGYTPTNVNIPYTHMPPAYRPQPTYSSYPQLPMYASQPYPGVPIAL
mmetsp:Transcript_37173/g.60190  ORF Transcript_37173/g.60190 Transcript_37173/m.60190 type:complete len:177 (+) Transcript_37173:103-633(+)